MSWKLRSTSLRTNVIYYISYYMTLNTLFATILPIGALLFFSLSTIQGLNSIRKLFETSVPMRMSSARLPKITSNHEEEYVGGSDQPEKTFQFGARRPTRLSLSVSFKSNGRIPAVEQSIASTDEIKLDSTLIAEQTRKNIAEPSAQEKRLTRISIAITIIYILCHMWKIPLSIYEAWYTITHNTTIMNHTVWWDMVYEMVNDISHLLILANSAFNFIIYLLL